MRENLLGNNIWKLPDDIFLGLYRTAPWSQMERTTPQRYFLIPSFFLFCSLFTYHLSVFKGENWYKRNAGIFWFFFLWKRQVIIVSPCWFLSMLSSRSTLPRFGGMNPSTTGWRCVTCWGAFMSEPSPSTELWATSPQETTKNKHPANSSSPSFQSIQQYLYPF